MPRDNTQTTADMGSTGLHPAANVAGGQTVHVTLRYADGVAFSPANLLAALKTQYGATKVGSDLSGQGRGTYEFIINP